MRKKLTAATLDRLPTPPSGQVTYHDGQFPGLALRVSSGGARSWVYFGRLHGRLKMVTLARYPYVGLHDARLAAGATAAKLEAGTDVTAQRRAQRQAPIDTVAALVAEWLASPAKARKASTPRIASTFAREVLPYWGERPVSSITGREAAALVDRVANRGTIAASLKVRSFVVAFFRWAVVHHRVAINPIAGGLPKPGEAVSRDRVLSDHELKAVWAAAGDPALGAYGPATRLLILSGCRRSEVSGLLWAEVDLVNARINLPSTRTKTGIGRAVSLADAAIALLRSMPQTHSHVFVGGTGKPIAAWAGAKRKLDEFSGVHGWVIHDLRRVVATGLERLNVALPASETILGHIGSRGGVAGIYHRHRYERESAAALNLWAIEVERIVTGTVAPPNVIPMR